MRSEALTAAPTQPMTPGPTQVEVTLRVRQRRQKDLRPDPVSKPVQAQIPRVTRLMALAIKFQDMVDRGEVHDYADIARLGYVSRARMTQIMNLLLLAPDLQEQLLFFPTETSIQERHLRSHVKLANWHDQRERFESALRGRRDSKAN